MKSIDEVVSHVRQDPSLAPIYAEHLRGFAANHQAAVRLTTHPETQRIAQRLQDDCLLLATLAPPETFSQRLQAFMAAARALQLPRAECSRLCRLDDEARSVAC